MRADFIAAVEVLRSVIGINPEVAARALVYLTGEFTAWGKRNLSDQENEISKIKAAIAELNSRQWQPANAAAAPYPHGVGNWTTTKPPQFTMEGLNAAMQSLGVGQPIRASDYAGEPCNGLHDVDKIQP